jgi:hypothetical protein
VRSPSTACWTPLTAIDRTLDGIADNLNEIKDQNKLLMVVFRNLNKDKVDGCVVRIDTALEKFTVRFSPLRGHRH